MNYDHSKEMQDALKETNSDMNNTFVIFEVKSLPNDLKHGDSSVTNYFNTLSWHWQQLNLYEDVEWNCPFNQRTKGHNAEDVSTNYSYCRKK